MSDVAMGMEGFSQRDFRVGRAINRAVGVFFRHALSFSVMAGLVWVPVAAFQYLALYAPAAERPYYSIGIFGLILVIQPIATAVILHAAFQDMRGRSVRFGESISQGFRRFFPLLGVGFLSGLGVAFGLVLLVVPGLMLLVRWFVAAPVCVVERAGPLTSLGRSADLTKGQRWKIFGYYILLLIFGGVVSQLAVGAISYFVSPLAGLLATAVWQGVWNALLSVLAVVIYYELRVAKEGVDIERVASVFD